MDNKSATKSYNPKSHAPSVYMPNWLIQISIDLLSTSAKVLYGRLSQWSSSTGEVFRSAPELAQELGMKQRTIEKFLKELRDVKLIETFQPQLGGKNHFRFLDHYWIYEPINKHLSYDSYTPPARIEKSPNLIQHPPHNHAVPPAQPCGTPPHNRADINKKEIEINTTTTNAQKLRSDFSPNFEPVVVISSSSLNPTPKTKNIIFDKDEDLKNKLVNIYRDNPFVTNEIICEEDFISAAMYSIEARGDISINRRLAGITALVKSSRFEGEQEWIIKAIKLRNRKKGDELQKKVEEQMRNSSDAQLKAPIDRKQAFGDLLKLAAKNKAELIDKPCYAIKNNKPIKFAKLPEKYVSIEPQKSDALN